MNAVVLYSSFCLLPIEPAEQEAKNYKLCGTSCSFPAEESIALGSDETFDYGSPVQVSKTCTALSSLMTNIPRLSQKEHIYEIKNKYLGSSF